MGKKEYFTKFEKGLQSIEEGKGKKMTIEQVNELLDMRYEIIYSPEAEENL
jgi:hypothetical protein